MSSSSSSTCCCQHRLSSLCLFYCLSPLRTICNVTNFEEEKERKKKMRKVEICRPRAAVWLSWRHTNTHNWIAAISSLSGIPHTKSSSSSSRERASKRCCVVDLPKDIALATNRPTGLVLILTESKEGEIARTSRPLYKVQLICLFGASGDTNAICCIPSKRS